MLTTRVVDNRLCIGEHFAVSFMRTLRIPDDGNEYPLPPGLGSFPICRVEDYADRVPVSWREHGGVFIPMYQREALWLNFNGHYWHPSAVKVGIGKINALSARRWGQSLAKSKQDYMVVPDQPWLDGINAGNGFIRQFVAMPLGMGYTVERQLTGKEEFGGLQFVVYEAKPGKFPDEAPQEEFPSDSSDVLCCAAPDMGLGAGGKMRQKIYPDEHGIDTWDPDSYGRVYVHIVNSMVYRDVTGLEPPPTPVSAKLYNQFGLPWFDLYDEGEGDVEAAKGFKKIKSVKEIDEQHGFGSQQDDDPIDLAKGQVKMLGKDSSEVEDGKW